MKKLIGVFLFVFCAIILAGCVGKAKKKIEVSIYGNNDGYMRDEFLDANRVYGASYYDKDAGKSDQEMDESTPKDRTFVVKDQETLNTIVKEGTLTVDFTGNTVFVYLYMSYYVRQLKVTDFYRHESEVSISFTTKKPKPGYKDNNGPTASYAIAVVSQKGLETCTFTYID